VEIAVAGTRDLDLTHTTRLHDRHPVALSVSDDISMTLFTLRQSLTVLVARTKSSTDAGVLLDGSLGGFRIVVPVDTVNLEDMLESFSRGVVAPRLQTPCQQRVGCR
jgi:hypothetical protein